MKLVLDEMISAAIAEQLRARGHDVIAVCESPELRGLADVVLFEWAQEQERAVVTYNRLDFLALDRRYRDRGRDHRGVVILHPRRFPQRPSTVGALVRSLERLVVEAAPYPGFVRWLQ